MKLRSALVAAGLVALPAAAIAQPVEGLYVGAGVGYNYTQDQEVKSAFGAGGATSGAQLQTNGGIVGLGNIGWGFGNGLRVELEGNYINEHNRLNNAPGAFGGGLNQTYGAFVNGLFDFDVGLDYLYPYVGAGVGWEQTTLKGAYQGSKFNDDEGAAAVQGILGAAFPIPDVPGLSVTAEYRFVATVTDEKFHAGGAELKASNQYNHEGLLGLRYAFGVEPPPPPPAPAPVAAPAPAPARTYLVFFDWDKADLSARARQIIAEAAQNASRVHVTRIEVSGHADLSGTHAYNQRLSQRRADAVAAELVRLGIPKEEIAVYAYGDTHPLVPTAPGVREPQNRRVEIVLK